MRDVLRSGTLPRILCVDDDPHVLDALARQLRRVVEVVPASDARTAMQVFVRQGPFPVVISDQRMPVVDGISLLSKIAQREPDTVRILLTGFADIDSAVRAVNRGGVFRFLTKPCRYEDLASAVQAALEQYRLVRAERELLDETLRGSIRALTGVLALSSPLAFGRAERVNRTVKHLCSTLEVDETWAIEVAALLSPIGCISLMDETVERLFRGETLDEREAAAAARVPSVTQSLLRGIPRLEPVLEILHLQGRDFVDPRDGSPGPFGDDLPLGARLLRIALDFDDLCQAGRSGPAALGVMRSRTGAYDPDLLEAFSGERNFDGEGREVRRVPLGQLREGMVVAEDVLGPGGGLLIAHGVEIGPGLLARLRTIAENVGLTEDLLVAVPTDPMDLEQIAARTPLPLAVGPDGRPLLN